MQIHVFNYNTLEKQYTFDAHDDYIRSITVHPTKPYVLSCSDDSTIKLWNWERSFLCQQEFQGHKNYVMQVVLNPKNDATFASASLDGTVKIWQLDLPAPNFSLHGHGGVNCVGYHHKEPNLISGGDDGMVKIWDYRNRTCVRTLELHTNSVTAACCLGATLVTISEDGIIGFWDTGSYCLKSSVNNGLGRGWAISSQPESTVAVGFDEGAIIVQVGGEMPAISMDVISQKIVYAKSSEIQQINLKTLKNMDNKDGDVIPATVKEMVTADFTPKKVLHSPNGRFVAVQGENEYVIYTSVAFRCKAYGEAQDFTWAYNGDYAILEKNGAVKVYTNFKEKGQLNATNKASGILGGQFLCLKSNNTVSFYDWETMSFIRAIEELPRIIYWSENGELVCLATENGFYILKYDVDNSNTTDGPFMSIAQTSEVICSGIWSGDCFVYATREAIKYFVAGDIYHVSTLPRPMDIIGYIKEKNSVYLTDKDCNIVMYTLPGSVLDYKSAVLQNELEMADKILPNIPMEYRSLVAQFLERKTLYSRALDAAVDPKHRFELALSIGNFEEAKLALQNAESKAVSSEFMKTYWSRLGDAAITSGNINMTETCYRKAQNFSSLLLLGISLGDKELILDSARLSHEAGVNNIAFRAYSVLGLTNECIQILISEDKFTEAAFFARSYEPGRMTYVVELWRQSLAKLKVANNKVVQHIADPEKYVNLFPELCVNN